MSTYASILFCISSLALITIAGAQGRAPHGLVYESPIAFSPTAYDFFHPKSQNPDSKADCTALHCSPLPMAAQVDVAEAGENKLSTPQSGEHSLGAGGIAGIVFGLAFVAFLAMGAYYIAARRRRANTSKGTPVQPDA